MGLLSLVTAILVSTITLLPGISSHEAIKKTIKSENGDIIDCVDIYKQPAFNNPRLQNHTIQMRPSKRVTRVSGKSLQPFEQEWRKSGSCPKGTVPILRTPPRNTSIAADVMFPFPRSGGSETMDDVQYDQEWAVAYTTNGPYKGGEGAIFMWDIHVEPNEYSNNFILVAGATGEVSLQNVQNVIAAGWTANPILYGDTKPRLYLSWSNNAQEHKNCLNFDCNGFIQTNHRVALGSTPPSVSQPGGAQVSIQVGIHRDGALPKWWIAFDNEDIGYILDDNFSRFEQADYTMWGGQVQNSNPGGEHTTTQMGSGQNIDAGVGYTGMIGEYLNVGANGQLFYDPPSDSMVTHPKCYGYKGLGEATGHFGYYMLYGGSGFPNCDK